MLPDSEDHASLAERIAALHDPALRSDIGRAARLASAGADIRANCRAVEAVLAVVASEGQSLNP